MLQNTLKQIYTKISAAEQQYHRQPNNVALLAVSKQQSINIIEQAFHAGQKKFAENYLQEAWPKIIALKHLNIEWHFIGKIQSNKTRAIAENFSWVHSVDSYKIARRLSEQRSENLPPLNILIEINIADEPQKNGIQLQDLVSLAQQVVSLPHLHLRGLMIIPPPSNDFSQQRAIFAKAHQAFIQLQQQGFAIDTLSMGMTHDFVAAIAEGATIVRVGTGIFGARK